MEIFINAFNTILYQPLFNALIFLYQFLPGKDFGIAIIVLTIIVRIIFYPLMMKSIKSQKAISELQPKIQEVQQKFKNDKEKQAKEMMALYQKEKINPFGGCLPLLIQLPIMIALYRVFWKGLESGGEWSMNLLYGFMPDPGAINPLFLGLLNLADPIFGMAVFAGILQFFQTKMMMAKNKKIKSGKTDQMAQFSNIMQKQMVYFFPVFTVIILLRLPSAIALYWSVTALFSIFQQRLAFAKQSPEDKKSSSLQ